MPEQFRHMKTPSLQEAHSGSAEECGKTTGNNLDSLWLSFITSGSSLSKNSKVRERVVFFSGSQVAKLKYSGK